MNKSLVVITGLGAIIALGWSMLMPSTQTAMVQTRNDDAVAGQVLYQENCASCHGANLEGEPDWRSPKEDGRLPASPHDETGHTWHHGEGLLFNYTKLGGKEALAQQGIDFNSGMPGFAEQLSDQQIWDILAYIKSTWPAPQQELQATRTEAERLQKEANQ
ncbi:MAG: cytochrome C [Marinosulfonomonas sp.]|nr:MAG: cytochrome C [Marinosulfonomonas sp.]